MANRNLKVEWRALDDLVPYARNARTHSDGQITQIANSIKAFGWTNPVLIDGAGGIIAGHGRVLAARQLGKKKAPCIKLAGLSKSEVQAYVLADNKLALNAGWDDELLAIELGELSDAGFDMPLIGFDDGELAALLGPDDGLTDPDDAPVAPDVAVTRPGDVWAMGGHRALCGDATAAEAVDVLLAGAAPHLMVTDPPYGVEYDPDWRIPADLSTAEQI